MFFSIRLRCFSILFLNRISICFLLFPYIHPAKGRGRWLAKFYMGLRELLYIYFCFSRLIFYSCENCWKINSPHITIHVRPSDGVIIACESLELLLVGPFSCTFRKRLVLCLVENSDQTHHNSFSVQTSHRETPRSTG